jgi:hypothetical protein
MRIVGTSRMQTVAAAPKLNVGGSVVVVAPGVVVDDDDGTVEVVDEDVVVPGDVEGGVVVDVEVDGGTSVVVVVLAFVFGVQSSFGHWSIVVVVVLDGGCDVVVPGCSHGPPVSVAVGQPSLAVTTMVKVLVPSSAKLKPLVKATAAAPLIE